jgi:hypothetical protein
LREKVRAVEGSGGRCSYVVLGAASVINAVLTKPYITLHNWNVTCD